MTKTIRSMAVLAATVCLAGSMGFAQSAGEAVYKANCQSCHGSTGTPSAGIAPSRRQVEEEWLPGMLDVFRNYIRVGVLIGDKESVA